MQSLSQFQAIRKDFTHVIVEAHSHTRRQRIQPQLFLFTRAVCRNYTLRFTTRAFVAKLMSKKKMVPQKIKDPEEVRSLIMEWFERENKPVTPQSLTDALGSRVAKALVQKNLEELLVQQKLQAKDLKKVRFFYLKSSVDEHADGASQSGEIAPTEESNGGGEKSKANDLENERAEGDEQNGEHDDASPSHDETIRENLVAEVIALAKSIQEKGQSLSMCKRLPTTVERAARRDLLESEVRQLQSELDLAESRATAAQSGNSSSASVGQTLEDVVYSYQKARFFWKERKELMDRLVEGMLGDACSKTELAEMFGITSDKEAGVSFADSAVQLPPSLTGRPQNIHH